MQSNPALDVEYLKSGSRGYPTWTVEEVVRFQERFPIGTKARLALDLLLYTGQRRSDVVRFGPQHVSNGTLTFTQFKGRNRHPKTLTLPILPVLQATMDATPCGESAFLETEQGRPFTSNGFGNWFRDRCIEAGVPGRAHGLRKAGATIAANNGATAHHLQAIFGWSSLRLAEVYTCGADQRRLAAGAMHMIDMRVPPATKVGQGGKNA
jgi:integrase